MSFNSVYFKLDETQKIVVYTCMFVEIACYSALLGFLIYMTSEFLIKLKFYRQWHCTLFYINSGLLVLA
jgi:hypothetical protein